MADTPESYHTLTPYLIVADADAEIRFLEAAFGAAVSACHRRDDGSVQHAELRVGDSTLMLAQGGGPWPPLASALYVWIPDVDAVYARALAAGARSESAPEDKPYGHRGAGVIDGNGITWWLASPLAPPGDAAAAAS